MSRAESRRERELAIIEEALHTGRAADSISENDCRELRERVAAGQVPKIVATDDGVPWSASSVRTHAYGHCQHDAEAVGRPATPPSEKAAVKRKRKVTRDDCEQMRARSQRGDRESDIADAMGVGLSTVNRHIRGVCSIHAGEGVDA